MKIHFGILIPLLLFSTGCSLSDEELWLKIEQAKANDNWDSTRTVSLRILKEYPQGRYSGWARFALAESYRFLHQPREALDQYKLFVDQYPDLQPAAVSLFLVGYLYANNLSMTDSARFYFDRFLEKYPNHDLAPSVKLELETLGRPPHEALNGRMANEHERAIR